MKGAARRSLAATAAQWPVLAAAWLIHGALLLFQFFTQVPGDVVGIALSAAILLAILCLLLVEIALLCALAWVAELAGRLTRLELAADLAKSLGVALAAGLLGASILKQKATGAHLKLSDLWFAQANFRQIVQEAQLLEAATLLALPTAVAVLCAAVFLALRRRRRAAPRGLAALALAGLVAAGALAALHTLLPQVRLFTDRLAPEGFWLARRAAARTGSGGGMPAPEELAGLLGEPIERYRPAAPEAPSNVVLIMLESIPWGRTSLGGGPPGTSPNLEKLAAESVVFTRPYATSTHSDYAQMSILSSLHPRKYRRHDYYARIEYPRTLLWDALDAAGYATAMFSCQNERWGNMLSYLDTPGLNVLRHALDWPAARHRGSGPESKVWEETPVSEWIRWRQGPGREPYLTYLNFQSNHFAYDVPPEAERPFAPYTIDFPASFFHYPPERAPVMLNRFYNALLYGDRWLGEVVRYLEQRGELERTALVVVSDHGEAFYEHGQPTHGAALHEEQVRSLLLMRLPGERPRRVEEPVSLLDPVPALLRYLGLPPHGNFQGRADILDPGYRAAGRPLFFTIQGITEEDGVLLDDLKLTVNWDTGDRRLFDLALDPGERTNLVEAEPAAAAELEGRMTAFLDEQAAYYENGLWRTGRYLRPLP